MCGVVYLIFLNITMPPNSLRSDCKKFAPNIFNKTKCSNCFKQKEEHSQEALECNRASRKVAKSGYLFVAPGWDFSIPLNRTKRWQRRWFVLYDDGELNYSVDEHPDTVPQASIDMTQVLEVASAEDVTGHVNSLAITAPDGVTFVKAVTREDARNWTNVLSVYARNKGRHKRNATFPGGQTTTIHQPQALTRSGTPNPIRPRYNSCHSDSSLRPMRPTMGWIQDAKSPALPLPPSNITTSGTTANSSNTSSNAVDVRATSGYRDQPPSSASPPTRDKLNSEEKAAVRTRRLAQQRTPGAVSTPNSEWLDSHNRHSSEINQHNHVVPNQRMLQDYDQSKRDEKLKDIAAVLTRPRSTNSPLLSSTLPPPIQTPTRDSDSTDDEALRKNVLQQNATSEIVPTKSSSIDTIDGTSINSLGTVSGDHNNDLRVELPAEDLLNLKKGWLMLQSGAQWNKCWFVLCGYTLTAYRDPDGEDAGNPEMVLNLSSISAVVEVQVARNYGFQVRLWNDAKHTLSAVTSGIRSNWMQAIRKAAGLDDLSSKPIIISSKSLDEKLHRDLSTSSVNQKELVRTPSTPLTPRSLLFSSDEEYKTASEGGRRESVDWVDGLSALPPSPPLNRTPISRVKDRARSRSSSRSRLYKRSRSSPPSSRNSTLDSVSTEDFIQACCGDVPESELEDHDRVHSTITDSSIIEMLEAEVQSIREQLEKNQTQSMNTVEKQSSEIDELRKKLKNAINDLNNSEQELIHLRKIKTESMVRENRMEELLTSLENMKQQLNQRTKELEAADSFKLLHTKDKEWWDLKIKEKEIIAKEAVDKYEYLRKELISKDLDCASLQEELSCLNNRLTRGIEENDYLYKRLQDFEGKGLINHPINSFGSLSDLTNIDLDLDFNIINKEGLMDQYDNLKSRFEKAVQEIRAMKKELRDSHIKYDDLELANITLKQDLKRVEDENQAQNGLMAARVQDLTLKLTASEKQVRNLKSKLQDSREKRRSLSLKGRESFSINKEVEDKITELEAKILAMESDKLTGAVNKKLIKTTHKKVTKRDRSSERASPVDERTQRRLRRKSLDSATTSEPMKVLIRLSSLESKVSNIELKPSKEENLATSTESLSISTSEKEPNNSLNRILTLESTVAAAKEKLNECLEQINILKHVRRTISPITERLAPLEKLLTEIDSILKTVSISTAEVNVISESVTSVVKSFESLLKNKLTELLNKRNTLRETGKLNSQSSMQILAEKLAYETILISRIRDALTSPENEKVYSNRIIQREIIETSQLMKVLKNKLNGSCIKKYFSSKISEDYLTRVLTRKLIQVGFITNNNRCSSSEKNSNVNKGLDYLLNKQRELNLSLQRYKSSKLEQLAYALALETFNYATDTDCRLEKRGIDEARKLAQETVSAELIQSEISHVMMRCAQMYENNISTNHSSFFSFFASERAALELWSDTVEERLRTEMEKSVEELSTAYKNCLTKLRQQSSGIWRRRVEQERNSNKSRQLLSEFADIIAHKALVDSRLSVLTGDCKPCLAVEKNPNVFVKNLVESNQYLTIMEDCGVLESDLVLDSEFQYLYQRYSQECELTINKQNLKANVNKTQLKQVAEALSFIEKDLLKLQAHSKLDKLDLPPDQMEISNWNDVCVKCTELQNRVNKIASSIVLQTKGCTQCEQLRESLNRFRIEHEKQILLLREDQEHDLVSLRGELEHERASLVSRHETEQTQLKERARMLERRLGTLDSEYAQQLDNLRAAYRKTINSGLEGGVQGEDNIRQRYQAEIEQLRVLCEKGLMAVENSHRRVVAELEDKHRKEREQLRMEKEQALAEETQATLAALDAMRKAHESEVRREINKFKQDFIRKMQTTHDIGALHKEHEQEMQEIKQEILSLSERYSVKCVESASLEEQLCNVNQQLAQAQQHIQQLDSRNKQLRAHLALEASEAEAKLTEEPLPYRQEKVSRRGISGMEGCKPKINTIRNPQLSPMQN